MKTITTILLASMATITSAQTKDNGSASEDSLYKSVMLEEVRVSTPAKTKMKGNSMVTRVAGTAVATAGTAEDVLSRIPGMMKMKGELQVIGKGSPTYYSNRRTQSKGNKATYRRKRNTEVSCKRASVSQGCYSHARQGCGIINITG